jgi:hypothetical protein
MNRTIRDATVKRYYDASHDALWHYLQLFVDAYNYGRRLETLRGLTPYAFICQTWTTEPERFRLDPSHLMPGPNIQGRELIQSIAGACVFFPSLGFRAQEDRDGPVVLALG